MPEKALGAALRHPPSSLARMRGEDPVGSRQGPWLAFLSFFNPGQKCGVAVHGTNKGVTRLSHGETAH